MGLHGLLRLNLSNNLLQQISPDDLIGLEDLRLLDVSHNHITTLEETSKVCLYTGVYILCLVCLASFCDLKIVQKCQYQCLAVAILSLTFYI